MTQEELDSLMSGEVDLENLPDEEPAEDSSAQSQSDSGSKSDDKSESNDESEGYRVSADRMWPPPPPTDDHKVVNQLDDVTKDSEIKATEMFDKLENTSTYIAEIEDSVKKISSSSESLEKLITTLQNSFPKINAFINAQEAIKAIKEESEKIETSAMSAQDEIIMTMDVMQYQDIHRQKIERVINVMRALSQYMNSLFEGKLEDSKRVSSATHIDGDSSTEDVVTEDDIEALIATLGKKV
ncbi:MAG: chemotaxis protein [Campylobacterales bacterium]